MALPPCLSGRLRIERRSVAPREFGGRAADERRLRCRRELDLDILVQALFHRRLDVLDDFHLAAELLGVAHRPQVDIAALQEPDVDAVGLPACGQFVAQRHGQTGEPVVLVDGGNSLHGPAESPQIGLAVLGRLPHLVERQEGDGYFQPLDDGRQSRGVAHLGHEGGRLAPRRRGAQRNDDDVPPRGLTVHLGPLNEGPNDGRGAGTGLGHGGRRAGQPTRLDAARRQRRVDRQHFHAPGGGRAQEGPALGRSRPALGIEEEREEFLRRTLKAAQTFNQAGDRPPLVPLRAARHIGLLNRHRSRIRRDRRLSRALAAFVRRPVQSRRIVPHGGG